MMMINRFRKINFEEYFIRYWFRWDQGSCDPVDHCGMKMIYNGFNIVNHNTSIKEENHNYKLIIGGLGRMSIEKNFLQLVRVFTEIYKVIN